MVTLMFLALVAIVWLMWRVSTRSYRFELKQERLEFAIGRSIRAFKVIILALASIIVMGYFFAIKWGGIVIFSKVAMSTITALALIAVIIAIGIGLMLSFSAIRRRG